MQSSNLAKRGDVDVGVIGTDARTKVEEDTAERKEGEEDWSQ
jgi:hypothetical protein